MKLSLEFEIKEGARNEFMDACIDLASAFESQAVQGPWQDFMNAWKLKVTEEVSNSEGEDEPGVNYVLS